MSAAGSRSLSLLGAASLCFVDNRPLDEAVPLRCAASLRLAGEPALLWFKGLRPLPFESTVRQVVDLPRIGRRSLIKRRVFRQVEHCSRGKAPKATSKSPHPPRTQFGTTIDLAFQVPIRPSPNSATLLAQNPESHRQTCREKKRDPHQLPAHRHRDCKTKFTGTALALQVNRKRRAQF